MGKPRIQEKWTSEGEGKGHGVGHCQVGPELVQRAPGERFRAVGGRAEGTWRGALGRGDGSVRKRSRERQRESGGAKGPHRGLASYQKEKNGEMLL